MNQNRRILIVDDEPYNQLGLKIMLSQAGYPWIEDFIDYANNGHEAIGKVEEAFKNK
jgi:CheY-like chemotaxis protein